MNMKCVFFGEELARRAPEMFGHTCTEPDLKWVGLLDIGAALQAGQSVTIRQASESELQRAEALIALREIGTAMGQRISQILNQHEPAVVSGTITRYREAIESVEDPVPFQLLDQKP